ARSKHVPTVPFLSRASPRRPTAAAGGRPAQVPRRRPGQGLRHRPQEHAEPDPAALARPARPARPHRRCVPRPRPAPAAGPHAGPGKDYATGRKNMQSLIQLRWIAVLGQVATIAVVYYGFDINLPLKYMLAVLGVLVAFNVSSMLGLRIRREITNGEIFVALL